MISTLVLALLLSAQDARRPVPPEKDRQAAQKTIREVFKEEYAKKGLEDRRSLARKLLQQAGETKDDPASVHVLLSEARLLAAETGEADTSVRAVLELGKQFEIDALALRASTLATAAQAAKTPEDQSACVLQLLGLADDAVRSLEHAVAEKALSSASSLARSAKNLPLVSKVDARTKSIAAQKSKLAAVKKAQDTLTKTPDDPEANGLVGAYQCFVLEDWATGLPLLAKGAKGPAKDAALLDAADPQDAPAQAAIGDAWWAVAEGAPEENRKGIKRRASTWYAKAQAGLTGLAKAKVEKRLAEAPLPEPPAPAAADMASRDAWKPSPPLSIAASKATLKEAVTQLGLEADYAIALGDADPALRISYKAEGTGFVYALDSLCRSAGVDYSWDESGIRLSKNKPREAATAGVGPFLLSGRVQLGPDGKATYLWLGTDWEPRVRPIWYEITLESLSGEAGTPVKHVIPQLETGYIRNPILSARVHPRSKLIPRRDHYRDLYPLDPPPAPGKKLASVRGRLDVFMPLTWSQARFEKPAAGNVAPAGPHQLKASLFPPRGADDAWIFGYSLQMATVPVEKRFALYGATLESRARFYNAAGRLIPGEPRGNSGGAGFGTAETLASGHRSFLAAGVPATETPTAIEFDLITDVWMRSYSFELRDVPNLVR
jgi:hypothetical protein